MALLYSCLHIFLLGKSLRHPFRPFFIRDNHLLYELIAFSLSKVLALIELSGTEIDSPLLDLMLISLAEQDDNAIMLIEKSVTERTTLCT